VTSERKQLQNMQRGTALPNFVCAEWKVCEHAMQRKFETFSYRPLHSPSSEQSGGLNETRILSRMHFVELWRTQGISWFVLCY
jgi:hypothetical protein